MPVPVPATRGYRPAAIIATSPNTVPLRPADPSKRGKLQFG